MWLPVVQSRYWFWLLPIHGLAAFYGVYTLHYLIEIVVLVIGIGLFLSPSYLYPYSRVASGWQIMAISWTALAIRQAIFLYGYITFDNIRYAPLWIELFLIVIYLPGIFIMGKVFYSLPFQRRSRLSFFLDSLALGTSITLILWRILGFAWQDVIFIGGNITIIYANVVIYQQERSSWRTSFRATLVGLVALVLSDTIWILARRLDWPLIWIGPAYSCAWLIFPRATLAAPRRDIVYNEHILYLPSPWQDAIGSISLLITSILLLLIDSSNSYLTAIILCSLVLLIRLVESKEYYQVQYRLDRARENESKLRYFIQGLGHDLKSPLISIENHIDILAQNIQEPLKRYLLNIQEDHNILQQRINIMLEIAREQQIGLDIRNIHLDIIMEDISHLASRLSKVYQADHIAIRIQNSANTNYEVYIDRLAFIRIVENVFLNAIQAQLEQPNGEVVILIRTSEKNAIITIADRGPGFRPKSQLNQRTAEKTGIGLVGVLTLIQAMHGKIDFSGQTGGGTVISIILPIAAPE